MIVAAKDKNRVVMGYSFSDMVRNATDRDRALEENTGLWTVESHPGCLFGYDINTAAMELLRESDDIFDCDIDYDGLSAKALPAIQKKLNMPIYKNDKGEFFGTVFVANGDRLYVIRSYGVVEEVTHAEFSGRSVDCEFLYGYFNLAKGGAEENILNGFRELGKCTKRSFFPVVIMDTLSRERKVVKE